MENPRVEYTGTKGGSVEIVLVAPEKIAAMVGEDLLCLFLKCFTGIDRLLTFEQLLGFNQKGVPNDSPAYDRNLRVLFVLVVSTLHEMGDALQALCSARVVTRMADPNPWAPLNEFRKKWYTNPQVSELRNEVGHHLGDHDTYRKGLAELIKEPRLRLMRASDDLRHSSEFELSWTALLRGMKIDLEQLKAVMDRTHRAHHELYEQLIAVFAEVLGAAGISVQDERT